jgi:hypothetical protein
MSEANSGGGVRFLGGLMIGFGIVLLVAIVVFIYLLIDLRASFTSSTPPLEDMLLGYGTLGIIALGGVGLIWWGRRLLRRA